MNAYNQTKLNKTAKPKNLCKSLLLLSVLVLLASNAIAQDNEAYFTIDVNGSNFTITFKYDNQHGSYVSSNQIIGNHKLDDIIDSELSLVLDKNKITTVSFDESCKNYPNEMDCHNFSR